MSPKKPTRPGQRRWKDEEDAMLHELYGVYKAAVVAKHINAKLGTTFTADAVLCRASQLGIEAASNQGHYTIAEAARVLGIKKTALHHYLKANGVTPMRRRLFSYLTEEQLAPIRAYYAPPPEPTVSTSEAARMLKCSLNNVYRLVDGGKLRAHRYGGHTRIATASIEDLRRARAREASMRILAARSPLANERTIA